MRKTNQIESITDEMVKKAIAKLKNKRASDRLGWIAEWLKEEGEEIVKRLSILLNRIKREQRTLIQWRQATISVTFLPASIKSMNPMQKYPHIIELFACFGKMLALTFFSR